ncbi:hypothetical protein R3P38DRAFT_2882724 [Favolaschia claudopus]|uniref:MYND-type domain-containing protein n=1 Tax=Favolaschia claudopus TaxID=2862362 RepID=A0AAW0D3G8_9AGAR
MRTILPHPSLRPQVLSRLPLGLQVLTTVAMNKSYGSQEILDFLHLEIGLRSRPSRIFLLPMFYAILDTAAIPTSDQLDALLSSSDKPDFSWLHRPLKCLDSLCALARIPKFAFLQLWQRSWPWIEFVYTFRHVLPNGRWLENGVCINFISLFHRIMVDKQIHRTPALRIAVLARTWAILVGNLEISLLRRDEEPSIFMLDAVFLSFGDVLLPETMDWLPEYSTHFLDAIGGNVEFSRILHTHMECFRAGPQDVSAVRFLGIVLGLVMKVDDKNFRVLHSGPPNAVVIGLTRVLCAMRNSTVKDVVYAQDTCARLLRISLDIGSGHDNTVKALDAGLMLGMIAYACNEQAQAMGAIEFVGSTFKDLLLPFTAHYAVLKALIPPFLDAEVKSLVASERFQKSGVWEDFRALVAVWSVRVESYRRYRSPEHVTFTACDNSVCGKIAPKTEFKRCAGCEESYYCSEGCQKQHWQHGGHRRSCQVQCILRLRDGFPLPKRGITFLRLILQEWYESQKSKILLAQVGFLRHWYSPSSIQDTDILTVIDFTKMPPSLVINTVDQAVSDDALSREHFRDFTLRAKRSKGRMQLFMLMVSAKPGKTSTYMFPLRSSDSRLYDGVRGIASAGREAGIGWSIEVLRKEVERLLRSSKSVVEIF